jgi:hypothetical protein
MAMSKTMGRKKGKEKKSLTTKKKLREFSGREGTKKYGKGKKKKGREGKKIKGKENKGKRK